MELCQSMVDVAAAVIVVAGAAYTLATLFILTKLLIRELRL